MESRFLRVCHWMTGGGQFALSGGAWPCLVLIPVPVPTDAEESLWAVPDYVPDFIAEPPDSGERR